MKDTIVSWTILPSLHGGSLETTLTVPLNHFPREEEFLLEKK